MARRSTSRQRMRTAKRVSPVYNANLRLPSPYVNIRPVDLRVFEDRRLYDPARRLSLPKRRRLDAALPSRVVETPRTRNRLGLSFVAPKSVLVCVRRKQRREVLFAQNKTGRGARTPKRRNEWSKVKC